MKKVSLWGLLFVLLTICACKKEVENDLLTPTSENITTEAFNFEAYVQSASPEVHRFFYEYYQTANATENTLNGSGTINTRNAALTPPLLDLTRTVIAYQDSQEDFIETFNKNFGLPSWEDAVCLEDAPLCVVPVIYEEVERTIAFLVVHQSGGYLDFKLVTRDQINQGPQAGTPNFHFSLHWMMHFDDALFGHRETRYIDWYAEENFSDEAGERGGRICFCKKLIAFTPGSGGATARGCGPTSEEICLSYSTVGGGSSWGVTGDTPSYTPGGSSGFGGSQGNPPNWWDEVSYIRMILFDFGVDEFNELPIQVQTKLERLYEWGELYEMSTAEQVKIWYECEGANNFEECFINRLRLTQEEIDWLDDPANVEHKIMVIKNLLNYAGDEDAQEIIHDHLTQLQEDSEYKAFVESTFSWSGVMWSIAKELVGDKMVDIILQFIPGFGQSDEIRDAVKAAKNGDWIEFTIEIGKIVVQNTPWGKLLKAWDAVDEMRDFYNKVKKIFDQLEGFSNTVLERVWEVVKKAPRSLRTNPGYFKYVRSVETPTLGTSTTSDYRKTFKEIAFPGIKHDIHQVHHAVPKKVFNNFVGIITQSELHSLENLRGIPKNNPGLHTTITVMWNQFYRDFPIFTRQQALDYAKQIDDQFGHLFLPPVR